MEAEKTRARAKQQEAIAAKMKVENQAIRDEAEADLSESFDRASGRRDDIDDASRNARDSLFPKKERTKTLTIFSTTVACARTSRGKIDESTCTNNRVQRTERWHNVGRVRSLTRRSCLDHADRFDRYSPMFATGEARPMLIAAEKSLKALNRNDITEVKAMKRPPVGVLLVIEAICIINNVKPIKVRRCLRKHARSVRSNIATRTRRYT